MQIQLNQSQKQIITQNMIQSVEILQMGAQELADFMKEKALENPVMELEHQEEDTKEAEQLRKMEWLSSLDEQNRAYYAYDTDEKERDYFDRIGEENIDTLPDVLHLQLIGKGYTDQEMEIFDYIAHCLDEMGFFKMPLKDLAEHFSMSEEEAERYLNIVKGLEPRGVCAADLKECLLLQLSINYDQQDPEWKIVETCMELLGKNQLHNIAKELNISLERVKTAVDVIRSLNPRPSQGFDNGEMPRYIVPDVMIVKVQEEFEILLNNYSYPSFHINKDYLAMYRETKDKAVKDYLSQKMKQAEHIQECISRRHDTLLNLTKCILDAQKTFFLYGGKRIQPMKLSDAAEKLGIHESTVSRALKDKYLQCCWGIFPLSYFFSREFVSKEGESSLSSEAVKEELRQVIEAEDKKKPFSDQKLADEMEKKGIHISRRTVTKYREAMGIPNGRERKEF